MATTQHGVTQPTPSRAADTKSKPSRVKRSSNQGLMKAVRPSAELAAIVGSAPLPRTEITKRLWDYIKAHGLQDPQNKRMINADAKLQPIMDGQTQVSMFELPKLLSRHVQPE